MRRWLVMAVLLSCVACGGAGEADDGAGGGEAEGGSAGGGGVVDQQPPGQAFVSVDGHELTLEVSPAVDCSVSPDGISYSFWVGDNSIVLGGGANLYDTGWVGSINLRIAEPEGQDGPVSYSPDIAANGDRIAIEGNSMSYSGPMRKQPPNDGTNPPLEDVGDGTFSVTCP